jgi:hypothetical protein
MDGRGCSNIYFWYDKPGFASKIVKALFFVGMRNIVQEINLANQMAGDSVTNPFYHERIYEITWNRMCNYSAGGMSGLLQFPHF